MTPPRRRSPTHLRGRPTLWAIGAFTLVIAAGLGTVAIIIGRLAAIEAQADIEQPGSGP